jgi:uncharacterized cupin superfamily protein
MFTITKLADCPSTPLENGRGSTIAMIGQAIGARNVDLHINVLRPGEPGGTYHYHEHAENVYWILAGTGRLMIEGTAHTVQADDVVYLSQGTRHSLTNVGSDELRLLEIYAPAGHDFVVAD